MNKLIDFCPHCGNTTSKQNLLTHEFKSTWYDETDNVSKKIDPICKTIVRLCSTCDHILLYDSVELNQIHDNETLLFPKVHELDDSVPNLIRAHYEDAIRVRKISPTSFAVIIRKMLESICVDRGVKKRTLKLNLDELAQRGEIPPKLAEMTDILRDIGNAGAHESGIEITIPMTWLMDDFIRLIIEYVYVLPEKIHLLKRKIKK